MMEWVSKLKQGLTSRKAFIEFLETPPPKGQEDVPHDERNRWINVDLAPSPPEDRKWNSWVYLAFWIANAAGVGNWTAGSSLIALGLPALDTWLALAFSHVFITLLIVLNGRGPARYHVGFPIMARSVYGMWGSYMVVCMRAIVCIIWNGVNSYYGGLLVTVSITAVFPQYKTLPNILPASAGITSTNLASFFIFMAIFQGVSFVHSRDLVWLYYTKSVLVMLAMHGVLIWWMVQAGGAKLETLNSSSQLSQTTHIWLVLQAFNTGLGTASSLSVNQGDMARYARKPGDQLWSTLIGYPISSALPCLYGILVASATKQITGTTIWNMWDTLSYMLDQYPDNRGARFLIFFCSTSFALAYMALNIATNSFPFGSDMSALFPRWMTIRRGQVLCSALAVAIVPWKLITTASKFVTFVSGYGYWLAPIAACLSVDYFIIKKGNIKVHDLYIADSSSRYWYYKGCNLRAIVATILSLIPCLPSFAAQLDNNHLGFDITSQRIFYISFVMTYFIAAAMYYALYMIFPEKSDFHVKERSLGFEQWANENDMDEKATARAAAGEDMYNTGDEDKKIDEDSRAYTVSLN